MIAAGAWYFLVRQPDLRDIVADERARAGEAARFSLVVLPFTNLSGDPTQDYLVDALTDELTTSLARSSATAS